MLYLCNAKNSNQGSLMIKIPLFKLKDNMGLCKLVPATLTPITEFIKILSRKRQGVVPSPAVNPGMVLSPRSYCPHPLLQISATEKMRKSKFGIPWLIKFERQLNLTWRLFFSSKLHNFSRSRSSVDPIPALCNDFILRNLFGGEEIPWGGTI